MSSREALRALQDRLALRLQAAPGEAEGAQARWLAVHAGGARYLVPLAQAGEIFPFAPPHPVPYTQGWFLGVAHLRGGLWAAVDLGAFIAGQAGGADEPGRRDAGGGVTGGGDASGGDARLVTFHALLDVNGALRIDRLAGLRAPEDFSASAPAPEGAPGWFASRYCDDRGEAWQALCLRTLARDPRFLALAA